MVLLFVPPLGGWVPGDDGSGCGDVPPGFCVPCEVDPGAGVLLGACGGGLFGFGVALPGLGAAVPGGGAAVPGVGAAVPGAGVALPGAGLALPGEFVCPGIALWPAFPARPPDDPALPEPVL